MGNFNANIVLNCQEETFMETSHFVVSAASLSGWQYSHKGDITGPFDTKDAAIEAAIAEAAASDDPHAEVMVRDSDLKTQSVWRASK
jgi:hypothetical protein